MLSNAQIRQLLDRYEAAETSIEEERQLKAALLRDDLSPEFEPYRTWFAAQKVLAKAQASERPGPWAKAEAGKEAAVRPMRSRRFYGLSIAASILLAALSLGIWSWWSSSLPSSQPVASFPIETPKPIDWSKYEVTDPQEAARITQAALAQVSTRLAHGSNLTQREIARLQPIQHAFKLRS